MIYSKIGAYCVGLQHSPLTNPPAPKFTSQGDAPIKFLYYPLTGTFPI